VKDQEKMPKGSPPGGVLFWLGRPKKGRKKLGFCAVILSAMAKSR